MLLAEFEGVDSVFFKGQRRRDRCVLTSGPTAGRKCLRRNCSEAAGIIIALKHSSSKEASTSGADQQRQKGMEPMVHGRMPCEWDNDRWIAALSTDDIWDLPPHGR